MKAIHKGQLGHVSGDDGDGLFLAMADEPATAPLRYVPFSDTDLIVDPTDAQIDEARLVGRQSRGERVINYARMNRVLPGQKARLTRAMRARDPKAVLAACKAAVAEWAAIGAWPDNWYRWNIALGDARWFPGAETLNMPSHLEDL